MIKLIEYSTEPNYYKGYILEIWLVQLNIVMKLQK